MSRPSATRVPGWTYHGTWGGYANHHCRCPHCREAARTYQQSRRNPIAATLEELLATMEPIP